MRPEVRQTAVFDVDPPVVADRVVVGEIDTVEEIDHRTDRRAFGRLEQRLFPIPVAGQGEEVTVGTPSPAERSGQLFESAEFVARAQQDLGGPDRARRENDYLADYFTLAPAAVDVEIMPPPRAVRLLSDVGHHGQRFYGCLFGPVEIVLVEGVLGTVLASDHAIAAVHAGAGCVPTGIEPRLAVGIGPV